MPDVPTISGWSLDDLYWAIGSINDARYAIAAVYAIQVYEWIDTLGMEYRLIWRARCTTIKIAYILCRYYPLLLWPFVMWAYIGNHNADLCYRVAWPIHALLAPCQFFSQAVMLMRAYAFSGRSKLILALLGICYGALLGVDIWVFCSHIDLPPELFYAVLHGSGCFPNYGDGAMGLRLGYSMLAAFFMDTVSLIIVIIHCYKTQSQLLSLGKYFLHQGLGAFAFVSAVNIASAVLYFRPPSFHNGEGLPIILVIPNIVACRVILDLRGKVTPTDSEISRRNSIIIRNAFNQHSSDDWIINN